MKERFRFEVVCEEARIREAVEASKEAFLAGEAERTVSHLEFLYQQSRYVKKRWWLLQGLLLACACLLLHRSHTDFVVRRVLGMAGPLFVILIVPEIWKNRSFGAVELEGTTYYTLRAIYAARLILFAGVDLALLSGFFCGASLYARVPLWEMLTGFLLPFNVTSGICFGTLYSRRLNSQAFSLFLCALWMGIWSMVVLNDAVFRAISGPVWMGLLGASCLFLGYTLYRGQRNWNNILEVKPIWI